jgi:hypothetical protein
LLVGLGIISVKPRSKNFHIETEFFQKTRFLSLTFRRRSPLLIPLLGWVGVGNQEGMNTTIRNSEFGILTIGGGSPREIGNRGNLGNFEK